MAKSGEALAREQRLAAKLRENLKRRKQQAKARDAAEAEPGDLLASEETPEPGADQDDCLKR